ncbi:PepSY-associated TM helix domain-containing protein [Shewanella pealeana]|uniref:PepSY-associated TM helix domain protein n=1 Tax=Shewanella pealeana (strain ATCC 700345 / ANG-SQ1) TaxID=398579 RepID=A8H7L7_SHEPA|nr:PepSY-associated TM helix domain-containing protein [Shewanella pealeana]ABV88554.1 PepSY-associated TM helix domain protein [Shewanella pealeana ATCC 700345]
MNAVSALKWFHNWVGFFISITMLIVLTTGVYLGSVDMFKRLDDKGQQYTPLSIEQKARVVASLFQRYPEMSTVRFPTEHTPYIQAATRGKTIALDNELNELSVSSFGDIPGYRTVFWLHRNFLLEDFGGKYINAWASLLGGAVTLVGIYLWWRVRKGFRLKKSIPSDTRSSSLLKSHIQLGLFISIPLFILCISGFLITYKSLWTGALKQPQTEISYPVSQASNWQSQLQTAQKLWPESNLVAISKPRVKKGEVLTELNYSIRFDSHNDVWLREADRMTMSFEQGLIKDALKHSDRTLSGKVASFVRPLHDALNMPLSYVVLITSVSIVGCMILLFSAVTFYRRIFAKKTKRVNQPATA